MVKEIKETEKVEETKPKGYRIENNCEVCSYVKEVIFNRTGRGKEYLSGRISFSGGYKDRNQSFPTSKRFIVFGENLKPVAETLGVPTPVRMRGYITTDKVNDKYYDTYNVGFIALRAPSLDDEQIIFDGGIGLLQGSYI